MKLYIPHCRRCNRKMNVDAFAHNRSALRQQIGGSNFYGTCDNCGGNFIYNVSEVKAEANSNDSAGGAIVGGLLGLIGGPIGLIIGGVVGGAIGNANDTEDQRQCNVFNNSF